jgi:hypothetical protein
MRNGADAGGEDKNAMKFLIILFFLIPPSLFSQYLEYNDIDIFINNKKNYENFIIKFISIENGKLTYKNDDWKNYFDTLNIISSDNEDGSIYMGISDIAGFHAFFNCDVPNELETFFNDIGWESNGNKKFWIISIGFILSVKTKIMMQNDSLDNEYELYMSILETFHEYDLEIIDTNTYRLLMAWYHEGD